MWFKSASIGSVNGSHSRRTAPSILSDGFRIDGDVAGAGEIHVAGAVVGNLSADKVTLGETGSVDGSVEAESAIINGKLQGRLVAVNVVLGRSAEVRADIVYCSMRVEPGAVYEGFSRRVEREHLAQGDAKQLLPVLKSLRDAEHGESGLPAEAAP